MRKFTLPNPFPGTIPVPHISTFNKTITIDSGKPKFKAAKAGEKSCLAVLIADASGSMSPWVKDTIGGCNSFVNKLKEDKSIPTKLLFVTFESENVNKVIDNIDINEVPEITRAHYQALGGTNLLDAVGQTVSEINDYLKSFKKKDRPSVMIQIITDGEENSSRRYDNAMVKEMVTEAQKKDWVFSFVGANIDSFATAHTFGVSQQSVSNYKLGKTQETYTAMATSMTKARSSRSLGLAGASISSSYYSDDDRKKMGGA